MYLFDMVVMNDIEDVEIEANGTFKYILIELTSDSDEKVKSKVVVRGYNWAEYHGKFTI